MNEFLNIIHVSKFIKIGYKAKILGKSFKSIQKKNWWMNQSRILKLYTLRAQTNFKTYEGEKFKYYEDKMPISSEKDERSIIAQQ